MKVKATPELNGSTITASEKDHAMLRAAWSAERDSFQDEIEVIAKAKKQDKLAVYAQVLFTQRLNDRFEYAQTKLAKVKEAAVSILISSGMSEVEARQRLGLSE